MTGSESTTRRTLLTAITAAGSLVLSGCLTHGNVDRLSSGPPVTVSGLDGSKVFSDVSAAESFSFGHVLSVSVDLFPAAISELGVTELEVYANGERPYSASTTPDMTGKKQELTVTVQLPVDAPAIIAATNEDNTLVEAIRVRAGGAPIFTNSGRSDDETPGHPASMPETPEIRTSTLRTNQTQFSSSAAVYATIENTSTDKRLSHLEVRAEFLDEAGEVVDVGFESLRNFAPEEIWEVAVPSLGDASDVQSVDVSIETAIADTEPAPPTNLIRLEDTLEPPADDLDLPSVTGRMQNTGSETLPYLEVAAKFRAKNGHVLGNVTDSVTGLPPNQVWEFSVEFSAYSSEIAERVDSYDLAFVT